MIASDVPVDANCRHVTYTAPVIALMVIALPWLVVVPVLIWTGVLHVTPQSVECVNIKCVGVALLFVAVRKSVYARYTFPAANDCATASVPPFAPTPGSFAVNEQVAAPARGISTAIDGLSKNCELLPDATMCVSMYVI